MDTDEPIPSNYEPTGYALIGACLDVHRTLGNGFLEAVYQESLELELAARGIRYRAQPTLPIHYKGRPLTRCYEADLIVEDSIVVELKAVRMLLPEHEAQLLHYLKATGKKTGYLVNFGSFPKLEWRRRVL